MGTLAMASPQLTGKPRAAAIIGGICAIAVLVITTTDERENASPTVRLEEPWVEFVPTDESLPPVLHRSCTQRTCETVDSEVRCVTSQTACAPVAEWAHEFAPYFVEHEMSAEPSFLGNGKLTKRQKAIVKGFKHKLAVARKKFVSRIKNAENKALKEADQDSPLARALRSMRAGAGTPKSSGSEKATCEEEQCVSENGQKPVCKKIKTNCAGMGGFPFPFPIPGSSTHSGGFPLGPRPSGHPGAIPLNPGDIGKILKKAIKDGKLKIPVIGGPPQAPGPKTPAQKKMWKAEFGGKKDLKKGSKSKKAKKGNSKKK